GLSKGGFSKRDVADYLQQHCTVPASVVERYWTQSQGHLEDWTLKRDVEAGLLSETYAQSDDPERPVPVNMRSEWIEIVLAGDPARNQARGYMNNHEQGFP